MVTFRCGRDGAAVKKDGFNADVERAAARSNSRGMRTSSLGATALTFSAAHGGAGAADARSTPTLRFASGRRDGTRGYARANYFHAALRDRVGGEIDGKVNPMLVVHEGETVQINLINGEGAEHDIVIDQYAARSDRVLGIGASSTLAFTADKTGEFIYFCSIAGHREAAWRVASKWHPEREPRWPR